MAKREVKLSKVVAIRVNISTFKRLELRAKKNDISIGVYIKRFIEKDLFRDKE
jgi:predicted HicB family RNase H-like nuclease